MVENVGHCIAYITLYAITYNMAQAKHNNYSWLECAILIVLYKTVYTQ